MTPKQVTQVEQMIRLRARCARSYREGHKTIMVEADVLAYLIRHHDEAEALRDAQGQPQNVVPLARARPLERQSQ